MILIDSNIYASQANTKAPISQGNIKESTLSWVEDALTEAQEEQYSSIVIHHNVFNHLERMANHFVVSNSQAFLKLAESFQLPISLSGHIHAQNIGHYVNGDYFMQEISTGAFSVYPSSVGVITLHGRQGQYQRLLLDVEGWASAQFIEDSNLLNYKVYMGDVFTQANQKLSKKISQTDDQVPNQLSEVIQHLNVALFAGDIKSIWPELEQHYPEVVDYISQDDLSKISSYIELLVSQREKSHHHSVWYYQ